jgi:hypothetical protein
MASMAHDLESVVLEGVLRQGPDGSWKVGSTPLADPLQSLQGREVVLIAACLDDERPLPVQTCRTCGTEFEGVECPRCRDARMRLRGTGS